MKEILSAVLIAAAVLAGAFIVSKRVAPVDVQTERLGAMSSNIVTNDTLTVGGVERVYRSQQTLNQGSTTACALRAPLYATSTLDVAVLKVGTSTDYTYYIAKGSAPQATTTLIRSAAVTTDGQVAIVGASTTLNAQTLADLVFSPGQYLNFGLNGAADFRAQGSCAASFIVGGGY